LHHGYLFNGDLQRLCVHQEGDGRREKDRLPSKRRLRNHQKGLLKDHVGEAMDDGVGDILQRLRAKGELRQAAGTRASFSTAPVLAKGFFKPYPPWEMRRGG
jgi:hypothetical protein